MKEEATKLRKRRNKPPKVIRFSFYCEWAYALKKAGIGAERCEYSFPAAVLDFLREIIPGDVRGEIREDARKVSLIEFCTSLSLPRVNIL